MTGRREAEANVPLQKGNRRRRPIIAPVDCSTWRGLRMNKLVDIKGGAPGQPNRYDVGARQFASFPA